MNLKDLLQTKTFWSGLSLVAYGVYLAITGNIEAGIQNVITGMSVIFLRDAVRKLQP